MDPKDRKYETVVAHRFDLSAEEWAREAKAINDADRRDGTLDFIDALFDDSVADEPEYKW